jgi:PelA/Pel-15E family pectate lyase
MDFHPLCQIASFSRSPDSISEACGFRAAGFEAAAIQGRLSRVRRIGSGIGVLLLPMERQGVQAARTAAILLAGTVAACCSTIGTNPPAQSLTQERIAQLPSTEQRPWLDYIDRSRRQRIADKQSLAAEMKRAGVNKPTEPPHSFSARSVPLDRDASWYASTEARHIADVVVSFQTPAGGWGKNLDMSKEPRRVAEAYAPNNISRFLAPGDFDTPAEPEWNYIGTVDNDATTTQIGFLARVIAARNAPNGRTYRAAFEKGMKYLFAAQYPNGGWPQVWPLEGGYHDAITYNDDAMGQVLALMHDVAEGAGDFSFATRRLRKHAADSFRRGIACIFASQIVEDGKPTVWPQQADPLTLKPVSARNFEPPVQCSAESANLLLLLMSDLPRPTLEQQRAVRSAAAWFEKTAIYGQSWQRTADGRKLVPSAGDGPIWPRYVQTGSDIPVFADRDKSIHNDVNELSAERRNGYQWYGPGPQRALTQFKKWEEEYPESR